MKFILFFFSTEGALRLFMTIPTKPNPIPSIHI